jgi:hypothetical protein
VAAALWGVCSFIDDALLALSIGVADRLVEQCRVLSLNFDFPEPDIPIHRQVAHKAAKRTLETCRLVFLKTEVAYPGKTVIAKQASQQVPRPAACDHHGDAHQRQTAAHKVQAVGLVAELGNVERVKLGKKFEKFGVCRGYGPLHARLPAVDDSN